FQRRTWAIQRVGWVGSALLLAVAGGGWFGEGPVSRVCQEERGLRVCYERYCRVSTETLLELSVPPPAGDELVVWFEERAFAAMSLRALIPDARQESAPGRGRFSFPAAGAARIRVCVRHEEAGTVTYRVAVEGGPETTIRHTVYP